MYEAYAACLVGVVCGAAAVAALMFSRDLSPGRYTAIHLVTILLMIPLVTLGYERIPEAARMPDLGLSRLLYIGVSWLAFVTTMACYRYVGSGSLPRASRGA